VERGSTDVGGMKPQYEAIGPLGYRAREIVQLLLHAGAYSYREKTVLDLRTFVWTRAGVPDESARGVPPVIPVRMSRRERAL
jgi:hypothetical protein